MQKTASLSSVTEPSSSRDDGALMLGGINNALFLQSLAGYAVIALILIPILKWAFPTNKAIKEEKAEIRKLRKEVRQIKRK